MEVIEGKEEKCLGIQEELHKLNLQDSNINNQETGVPYFWMHAICNCFQFKPLINDKDRKILQFLKDVRTVYHETLVNRDYK